MKHLLKLLLLAAVASMACEHSVDVKSGAASQVLVSYPDPQRSGQSLPGEFIAEPFPVPMTDQAEQPAEDKGSSESSGEGLPRVDSITTSNAMVQIGQAAKGIGALVSPNARTVAIGLPGDRGYWTVPVGSPSAENAPDLEVSASLTFDRTLHPGPTKLWLVAVDEHGRYGPPRSLDLDVVDPAPTGELVVSLSWSADMDLDLIVELPDGSTLAGTGYYDSDGKRVALGDGVPRLDLDSNIGCQIDGRRQENAIFSDVPTGSYNVYVRAAAACGLPMAGWNVRVLRDGRKVGEVSGVTYAWEIDTPNGGPEGPGRLAVRYDVGD